MTRLLPFLPSSTTDMQTTQHDPCQDIREAVRDLCSPFPGEYFRRIDDARGYPDAEVERLLADARQATSCDAIGTLFPEASA